MSSDDRELALRTELNPQRALLLDELRASVDGLVATELAARSGLHPNTVRWHLGALIEAGLVRSRPLHRGASGRPQIVYEAVETGRVQVGYRFLAELLASALTRSPTGRNDAQSAGKAWGQHLVDAPPPFACLSPEETAGRIAAMLHDHGCAPRRAGTEIEMHRCPFQEIIEDYGPVVCALHAGLVEGALDELGGALQLTRFVPFDEPGVCAVGLGPKPDPSPAAK